MALLAEPWVHVIFDSAMALTGDPSIAPPRQTGTPNPCPVVPGAPRLRQRRMPAYARLCPLMPAYARLCPAMPGCARPVRCPYAACRLPGQLGASMTEPDTPTEHAPECVLYAVRKPRSCPFQRVLVRTRTTPSDEYHPDHQQGASLISPAPARQTFKSRQKAAEASVNKSIPPK